MRRFLYLLARRLGDVDAITSGDPKRMARRLGNRWIGRHVVRRMWL